MVLCKDKSNIMLNCGAREQISWPFFTVALLTCTAKLNPRYLLNQVYLWFYMFFYEIHLGVLRLDNSYLHHCSANLTRIKALFAPRELRIFKLRLLNTIPYTLSYNIAKDETHGINTRPTMTLTVKKVISQPKTSNRKCPVDLLTDHIPFKVWQF